ncbi:MAG: outer membrane beta-barrel protein, partial [Bacteroidales bacterium]
MKKIAIIALLTTILFQGFSQASSAEKKGAKETMNSADSSNITKVVVGHDRFAFVDKGDEINVRVGNRGLSILESLEGKLPKIGIEKYTDDNPFVCEDKDDKKDSREHRRSHFRGHWAGCELGFNNYVTNNYSFSLPSGIEYMTLNSGKAMSFNLNFSQLSIGLSRHIGFVTGLGLDWNNYRFDGNNNIQKDAGGNIIEYDPVEPLKKSKLATLYLDLPVLFEVQIPTDRKRINISAGPIGAVKISSHSK